MASAPSAPRIGSSSKLPDAIATARGITWEVPSMQDRAPLRKLPRLAPPLRQLVRASLAQAVSRVTIPYWDWTKDR
jgi:hypothetical protein